MLSSPKSVMGNKGGFNHCYFNNEYSLLEKLYILLKYNNN